MIEDYKVRTVGQVPAGRIWLDLDEGKWWAHFIRSHYAPLEIRMREVPWWERLPKKDVPTVEPKVTLEEAQE